MANTKKGIDFIIYAGTDKIAGQRGGTLNQSADTIETTTKDSKGWKEFISSFKEWSVDADGLLPINDTGYEACKTAFKEGSTLTIKAADEAGLGYTGEVLITDFPIEMPYDDAATYSVTFQGTGELKDLPVSKG